MSSSTLAIVQTKLNLYGYSVFMVLGTIGNAFIALLFNKQHQNACAIYLKYSAILNAIYLIYFEVIELIPVDYTDGTVKAIILCKIITYIPNFLGQITKTLVIMACIDRYLITSDRVSFRAFSTPKRAKFILIFTSIFWLIFASHVLIMQTIINGQCVRPGIYLPIYTFYAILFIATGPTIILSIFGYLAYRNMRKMQVRIQPIVNHTMDQTHFIRRKDRDLLIIVIAEVFVYLILTMLLPIILIEMTISQYVIQNKSIQYLQTEIFINNFAIFLLYVICAIPFYIYLISSKAFRRDFKQLIINAYQKLTKQGNDQIIPKPNHALTQRDTQV
ncbi:unnamed protein product [Adineta steineri]|uniref:G-protein coupled receptors family 1 profile domain-containing protein n=1 Tax=Adineta steineri TaxID=433720 RepID=A0A819K3U2_9BILA|nr:unnamed protein product [Adineta steineri]CAF1519886.1 unnamed protein product [Adineta steineri]CAF3939453.1 unnamed protein product [Adineta steineri]CAF4156295.1 unnamed protein product [Adineta steineri]